MGKVSQEDLSFCWQQVLGHDPWFRLHHLFAPAPNADATLALNALTVLLEETLDSSEESLTITRLQWWRSELEPEAAKISAHPVLRVLRDSRQGQLLPAALSDPLMAQVLLRLQAEPLQDEAALKAFCNRVGRPKLAAQIGLSELEDTGEVAGWNCAGSGLASLMEFAVRSNKKLWWFVPLTLQARYQFDTDTLKMTDKGAQGALQAMSELLDTWFEEQIDSIAGSKVEPVGARRHLVAMSSATQLRMQRVVQGLIRGDSGYPGKWKFTDLLKVWSSTRGT